MAWEKYTRKGKAQVDATLRIRPSGKISLNMAAIRILGGDRMNVFLDDDGPMIGFQVAEDGTFRCCSAWISGPSSWVQKHVELPAEGKGISVPLTWDDDGVLVANLPKKEEDA